MDININRVCLKVLKGSCLQIENIQHQMLNLINFSLCTKISFQIENVEFSLSVRLLGVMRLFYDYCYRNSNLLVLDAEVT